jgi:hypothetical protein
MNNSLFEGGLNGRFIGRRQIKIDWYLNINLWDNDRRLRTCCCRLRAHNNRRRCDLATRLNKGCDYVLVKEAKKQYCQHYSAHT